MMDGSGYPQALEGGLIHYYARLTAVADVYDALTAKRIYKPAIFLLRLWGFTRSAVWSRSIPANKRSSTNRILSIRINRPWRC